MLGKAFVGNCKAFVDNCKSFSLTTCLGHIQPDDFPVPKLLMCLAAMRSKHIGITLKTFKSDLMNQFITVQDLQWTHSVDFQLGVGLAHQLLMRLPPAKIKAMIAQD